MIMHANFARIDICWTRIVTYFLIIVFIMGCAAKGPNTDELATGDRIHQQILAEHYIYTETEVNQYVSDVGEKISRVSGRTDLNYDFIIIYDDKIYSTAGPDGRIYITTGLLAFLENEAELAGVLAHEIGQVQYRHPQFSLIRKSSKVLHQAANIAGPFFGSFGALAMVGTAGFHAASSYEKSKLSRVITADKLALNYALRAGYDPQGLLDFLYRIIDMKPVNMYRIVDYYSNRPISVKRFTKLKSAFRKLPLSGRSFITNRERFLKEIKPVREMYKARDIG